MSVPLATPALRLAITAQALTHGGGAERYARDVVAGLLALGLRPLVIARKIDTELPQAQTAQCVALRLRGVPRLLRSAAFDWAAARVLRREGANCVFAINHSRHALVAICGGTHPGFLQAMGRRAGWADRSQIALELRTYAHARYIVAHSLRMRDELLQFYDLPREKIHVLYPPVDTSRFHPLPAQERLQARQRLGFPSDRPVFLLASTGHVRKGLPELAALFAQNDRLGLLAVAGRPLPYPMRNVLQLGYRADIETVYAAADFTVVASRYEPFGLVAVESVLCGTPVVIADVVGSGEVIAQDAKIAYATSDPQGLAVALQRAAQRARQPGARIDCPMALLHYQPDIAAHVSALMALFQTVFDGA
ncbi:MAG: glycosyltransferase family 4 protein [Thiomonas sp.]